MKLFFLLLILSILSAGGGLTAQNLQRQVIPGELPDPSVIEVDGVYYASGSSNDWGPVYPIYKSTDLKEWSFVTYVFNKTPAWTISSYWAPELFYHNGTFYCYYTARRTDGISCIGVATTRNISEGFRDRGVLIEWGNEAIDAFVYNEDGALYITWKAYGLTQGKPIQILGSELTPDGLSLKGKAFEILTAEKSSWEAGGIEGQCVVKDSTYLYMLYSGNSCCGGKCDYKVGVARAKTMKGPWEKYPGNPLIESNDTWKCPGHGTALRTAKGWYYLYHAYNVHGFPYLGRSTLLSTMHWGREGWPEFGIDSASTDRTIIKNNIRDHFTSRTLEKWWRYDVVSYTLKTQLKEGKLFLTEVEREQKNTIGSFIGISPDYAYFTMTTAISGSNEALKGLTIYATNANAVGIGVRGKSLIAWKVKDGEFIELNNVVLDHAEKVYLKANVLEGHLVEFHYSNDGKEWRPVVNHKEGTRSVVGDNLAWWSWGIKAGLFVKGDAVSGDREAAFDSFTLNYEND
ncbi:MAG TPA: family 43 glycosylhydrolase [Chryseolinea sp.]|nr:family 43 glycosylhydrolase [Chryseolinea sp.]